MNNYRKILLVVMCLVAGGAVMMMRPKPKWNAPPEVDLAMHDPGFRLQKNEADEKVLVDSQLVQSDYDESDNDERRVQPVTFTQQPVTPPFDHRHSGFKTPSRESVQNQLSDFEQALVEQAKANREAVNAVLKSTDQDAERRAQDWLDNRGPTSDAAKVEDSFDIEGSETVAPQIVSTLPLTQAPPQSQRELPTGPSDSIHGVGDFAPRDFAMAKAREKAKREAELAASNIDQEWKQPGEPLVDEALPQSLESTGPIFDAGSLPAASAVSTAESIPAMDTNALSRPVKVSGMVSNGDRYPGFGSDSTPEPPAMVEDSFVAKQLVEPVTDDFPTSYPLKKSSAEETEQPQEHVASAPKLPKAKTGGPTAALNAKDFLMASEPEMGAHWKDDTPIRDRRAWETDASVEDFSPDPVDPYQTYDPMQNMDVYQGKKLNANQRPLIELGRPWYQLGQLPESSTILGKHNPVSPQFIIFGDHRIAYSTFTQNGDSTSQIATELNLFWNLQLTATERFHMFVAPLDNGVRNTRYLLDDDEYREEFDFDVDFGYFEGDLGAIVGGITGETLPFDLPIAIGVMPLLVQNGIWLEDAFLGVAATIPARNSAKLDISNMDTTFFAGFDEIISPAFNNEDDAAKMWGVLNFIEANNGYWEIDYAFLEDRTNADRSYHNIGLAFSRRFGRFLSNSTRVIVNAGQNSAVVPNTADGVLLLSENSIISGLPSTIVPYLNMWAGFDRPQSAARAGAAGGVLRNTGILFETDGMTGFPTLDATGNDTFGGAMGINIMPNDFSQQLVLEAAAVFTHGNDATRNIRDDQYGLGFRYQLPLSNSMIFRADGMYGFLNGTEDIHGVRMELRRKF